MAELELALDEAIDRLNAGLEPAADTPADVGGLLDVARALRALPAEDWPDPAFPRRLGETLAGELAPRPRRRLRAGLALAAAAAVAAVALGAALTLGRSPAVNAATLARQALAAGSGSGLGPIRYAQVITNAVPRGSFEPVPPPPRVVETVVFAAADRWRVEATVTEPHGEGTTTILAVRNGGTIVTRTTSPSQGTTQTSRHAGAAAGLPSASAFGAQIDVLALLRQAHGRCARSLAPVQDGPAVAGRATQLLRLGASPCPSADMADANGPATIVVDRRTHLVLAAELHAASGQLTQRVRTISLRTGPVAATAFRLPKPLPAHPPAAPGKTAFTPLRPAYVPPGLRAGPVTPVSTQASTGRTLSATVTYRGPDGRAELQLYEAAASTPSVRFPGRKVAIRPGVTGTYLNQDDLRILWWIERGTYVSLQEGGASAGVPLRGGYPLATLLRIAASMRSG